ncbi:MAG TPA: ABC transporter ATP-binding protein [Candidatus Dormibacteraeota bacterium]|nr:ABC transporter ATP-binding protein [Candidatus Dormibacteraeota bacterium]
MKQTIRIIRFTKELWAFYIGVGALTILLALMAQLQPLFTKGAIDQITKILSGGKADVMIVALFALLIFVTDFLSTIFSNIAGYYGDILSVKIARIMSRKYFEHLLSLPQSYFDTELTGTIINRMNRGVTQISNFMNMLSNNFLQFIFSTVFTLIIVLYYSWQVGLMLGVLYPIFVWLTTRSSEKWQGYQKTINLEQDIANGRFAEAIGQVKVVKSFTQEKRELKLFTRHYDRSVTTTYPQSRYWHKQDIKRRIILNLIFFMIFAYIFIETAHRVYGIGTMVLLIQYALLVRIPIFSISFLVDQTQRALANTRDYFQAMDIEPEITDSLNAKKLSVSKGAVEFKDVEFAYQENEPVLKDISFKLLENSKTALVGESGQGKTTITSLLLRLYTLDKGTISIDGQDIKEVTQQSLRDNIAVVFQEPALFSGTIKENIAYANPAATDQQIIAAAKAANADEFINKLDKTYDAEIGERGLKLSGGQKQRIAIARALLKDAPILILDEATSSLDSKSEKLVQQALNRLMQKRTTLIIAHRLSTIQSVDQIITLKNGRVDEVGSPEELSESQGIYQQLLELQQTHTKATKKKLQEFEITS